MYYSPAGSYRLSSVNIGVIAGLFSVAFVQRQLFRERTTMNYQPKLRAGVVSAWLWRVMKKSIRPKQFPLKSYFHILSSLVHIISPYLSAYLCYEFYHLKVKVSQSCPTLCDPMDYTAHRILQARILEEVAFPFSSGSSRSNPGLLQCRQILYQLSHQGSPRILEWVAYPFL